MERNKNIDLMKAFAIITVVLGHSIQFGSGAKFFNNAVFFDNWVFKFIYSFHMPLFMLISGYLFYYSSCHHSVKEIIISRFRSLILPIITWSLIPFFTTIIHSANYSIIYLLKLYFSVMINNLWFLWAIFYCSLICLLVNKLFEDNWIIYIIGLIFTFIIPDNYGLASYKFMYPFFIIGYFYCKYSKHINFKIQTIICKRFILIPSAILYTVLLLLYNYDSYIYTSGYTLIGKEKLNQLSIDVYRFTIGFVGSIVVILSFQTISKLLSEKSLKAFSFIGANSLGIYILSNLIFSYVLPKITVNFSGINYFIAILETTIITLVCIILIIIIKRVRVANCLLLGGRM